MIAGDLSFKRIGIVFVVAVIVGACSSADRKKEKAIGPTLGDIKPVDIHQAPAEPVPDEVSLEEVEIYYERALDVAADEETRRNILLRLAGLSMLRSENQMLSAEQPGRFFDGTIEKYRELIQLQKQVAKQDENSAAASRKIDEMLYQLSKAYALDGNLEHSDEELQQLTADFPGSSYTPEALFRRAEQAFSRGDYREAQSLYQAVINEGSYTPFYQNAIYMHGWSQFKRTYYEEAIQSFTQVLDNLYGTASPIKTLSKSEENLAEDTLRVMSLSFAYLDGAQTITDNFADKAERPYIHKLYRALGELYLEKKRYRDSADAYAQFVENNPLSDYAPAFSGYIIDVYDAGNFPSLLIPAKEDYANNYGIDSEYWKSKPQSVRDALSPNLKIYLEELAKYEHANAQQLAESRQKPGKKSTPKVNLADPKPMYLKAAKWYEQYVRTFPKDAKTPDMYFLLAEALNEAGELERAYETYVLLAYDYELPTNQLNKGAEAGYSAILLSQQLSQSATNLVEQERWNNHFIDRSLAFADKYSNDARAANVLNEGAKRLLSANRQPEAILAATTVTQWQPAPAVDIRESAWLVIAQSEFDLQNYRGAEQAYAQVLLLMPADDPQRQSVVDRRAASIYKVAEDLLAKDQKQAAVDQLLSIQNIAPNTDIAITAQYDAGNYLMEMQQWPQAELVFQSFRLGYPNHSLTKTLPAKLVVIYQELQQWDKAANELNTMANDNSDPEVRRQSLLLAADLYQKSGKTQQAVESYERYLERYPQPFDEHIEAVFKLSELYRANNQQKQYDYWQNQLVVKHDSAGEQQSARSLYLAATVTNEQAKKDYAYFNALPLRLPLKKSLKRKRGALTTVVNRYQKLIDYGVVDYVTEANYYLGEIYAGLSQDLINSERPKGLDALALEQYEILLEEQAYPFEEKAIDLHRSNASRAHDRFYDEWVKRSFAALAKLSPGRYNKVEQQEVIRDLY